MSMKIKEPVYILTIAFLLGWVFFSQPEVQTSDIHRAELNATHANSEARDKYTNLEPADASSLPISSNSNNTDLVPMGLEVANIEQRPPIQINALETFERNITPSSQDNADLAFDGEWDTSSVEGFADVLTYQMEDDLTYLISNLSELDTETQEALMPRNGEKISTYATRVEEIIGMEKLQELTTNYLNVIDPGSLIDH